ncbi:MAG: DUF1566 domain-containing protein, partial [bacterium]|nr:DUF1566 domain-containing protein [bacterium]
EKALKVLKQAEKYKSTDELIALKKEVTTKLTIERDNTAFRKASKANTSAAFEEYSNTYPSGLHIKEAQKITVQLKEVERLKEIEKKKLLASRIRLRSKYTTLSKGQVKTMLRKYNFYDKYYNRTGHFKHILKLQTINETKVVLDKTTGLIWHQAGSPEYMKFDLAQKWVEALNEQQYAGHSNWRMPTLEEAASLMENKENYHGLFLSTLFSNELKYSFSGDKSDDNKIWAIDFFGGDVSCVPLKYESYILPVCSMK